VKNRSAGIAKLHRWTPKLRHDRQKLHHLERYRFRALALDTSSYLRVATENLRNSNYFVDSSARCFSDNSGPRT
jgi:hypothetical protein